MKRLGENRILPLHARAAQRVRVACWAMVWLAVWQLASSAVGHTILLPSPAETLEALGHLVATRAFWVAVACTLARISLGFVLALLAGVLLAALAARSNIFREFMELPVQLLKAAPVASFTILVLIWVPSENLSIIISFFMVFPIVYGNILEGIRQTSRELLEMARVFGMSGWATVRFVYASQAMPYLKTACSLALGLCWKAGIAAEVIGLPQHSMGSGLYDAKIYLDTPSLFAWTVAIIALSALVQGLVSRALARGLQAIESGHCGRSHASGCFAPRPLPAPCPVKLTGVCKSFGATSVLQGIDLVLASGGVTLLMGASGRGKTTVGRLVLGLDEADGGSVQVGSCRRAAVFQEDRLCENLNAVQNVMVVQRVAAKDYGQAVARAQSVLADMGLAGHLNCPVRDLSGGQRRRVAIARAVLADADVVVFDEPLKGLDADCKQAVMRIVSHLLASKTVLWITHDSQDARFFPGCSVVHL